MPIPQTFAFTTRNSGLARQLINQATISCDSKKATATALWDTGATGTCISTDIVNQLGLIPTGKKTIQTPSGSSQVSTYLVTITLPNNVNVTDVEVCDSEIGSQGIGMLIGMDIITLGDLSVSNYEGETHFSYRIPSRERTDYVAKLRMESLIGPKHGPGKRKKSK